MLQSLRISKYILAISGVLLAVAAYFALQLRADSGDIHKWLPERTEQNKIYDRFVDLFGHDDELILSWPGCTLEDRRLDELTDRLTTCEKCTKLFEAVNSGRSILDETSDKEFSFPREQLKQRLQGVFFDRNSDTTAMILQVSAVGKKNARESINELHRQIELVDGLAFNEVKIGGNLYTAHQINNATYSALKFSLPAVILAVLATFFCLRCPMLTFASLITAGCSGLVSLALIAIFGSDFNGLLVITPVLIMVLALSATVHLSCYYTRALDANKRDPDSASDPISTMLASGRRPCTLAVITTALGIIMLSTSHIHAVRLFSVYTTMGLIASLAFVLLVFPSILRIMAARFATPPTTTSVPSAADHSSSPAPASANHSRFAQLVAATIVVVSLALLPVLGAGIGKIKTALQPEKMFSTQSKLAQDSKWLVDKFSSAESVEVIVRFDGELADANLVDQVRQLGAMQAKLGRLPEVTTTFSIVNVCKMPSGVQTASLHVQEKLTNEALIADFARLEARRVAARTEDAIYWRIRLHFEPEQHDSLPTFLTTITRKAEETAATLPGRPETFVTGVWPLIATGRHQMFTEMTRSFVLAFVVITPLVMLLVRGFFAGLIAMLPNVLPALAFFGTIGWLGIEIDVGTILTACVGLGIAVDDTLHFLQEYMRNRCHEKSCRINSMLTTVKHCFRPMAYTTLICSAGLIVFVFSEFVPAQNFAVAICVLLLLALTADILVLPALLVSPLGRFFEPNNSSVAASKNQPSTV